MLAGYTQPYHFAPLFGCFTMVFANLSPPAAVEFRRDEATTDPAQPLTYLLPEAIDRFSQGETVERDILAAAEIFTIWHCKED